MGERGCESSFLKGIQVKIDIRTDISISIRPMITKFGKQAHLEDLLKWD